MKIKTIAAACLTAALLMLGGSALAGCGPSNEELVRQAVTDELERVKAHDADLLAQLAAGPEAEALAAYGLDAQEFLASYLEGFDYRIDDVTVEEGTAQATVVLTCRSFDALDAGLTEAVQALAQGEGVANMGEEETNLLVGQAFVDALSSIEPSEKAPIVLEFEQKDKAWTAAPSAEQAVVSALFEG